jgi:cell division protein FtsN
VLVGVLAILGVTFAAGALTGRFSIRPTASVANAKTVEKAPRPAPAPHPELTFYRELTAPLTPPPLPPKPAAKPAPPKRETAPAPTADVASTVATPRPDAGRYTVQVGSYNVRAQAEAMRARLAVAGHEAHIAEGEAGGVTRYRVRIGAYGSAEEARQAAVRLGSEAQVATYVTTW